MGTGRFERLERGRHQPPKGETEGPPAPSPRVSVAARFGGPGEDEAGRGPDRSGASGARFEEAARDDTIRVLEAGEGQPFVRCAHCRSDNYLSATRCARCDADLETPEHRAFNETLWRRTLVDREELDLEVAALRVRRESAEREQAEARRQWPLLEAELKRRRELGLPLDDRDAVGDPLRAGARWLGGVLGRAVARLLPSRGSRWAALALVALAVIAVCVRFPVLFWVTLGLALWLGGLAQRRRWLP